MKKCKPLKCDGCGVSEKTTEVTGYFFELCDHCHELAGGMYGTKLSTVMKHFIKKQEAKAQDVGFGNLHVDLLGTYGENKNIEKRKPKRRKK